MKEDDAGEFLEDYRREADDLLQRTTSGLLEMEALPPERRRRGQIDEVLRHLHTLKGLSGMVGLNPAVQVTHALESALRRVRRGVAELDEPLLDLLLDGVRLLHAIVAGQTTDAEAEAQDAILRLDAPDRAPSAAPAPPSPAEAENPLVGLDLPEEIVTSLKDDDRETLKQARRSGHAVILAVFLPTAEHAAAGVNVNVVRGRLAAEGELLKAVPLVSGREIRFGFLLSRVTEEPLADLPMLDWKVLLPASTPVAAAALPEPELVFEDLLPQIGRGSASSVRVDVARLDEVMRLLGELVVSRSRLDKGLRDLGPAADGILEASGRFDRQLRDLREAVMRTRMVPLSDVFGRMPLAVRDLARASGRKVRLVLQGEETQIDKVLVDRLLDPLLHLVRNSIAHGIESPEERVGTGKPEVGTLTLRGVPEGDSILIQVQDDGRGIDPAAVESRARTLGVLASDEGLATERILEVLCRPGFSTRSEAGIDAGRGVGMDAVRQAVDEMGGTLALDTEAGVCTRFTIRLPLTLAVIDCFFVAVGNERYAVPRDSVDEIFEVEPGRSVRVGRGELYPHRGQSLPLLRLRGILDVPRTTVPSSCHALVHRGVGFVVDRVLGLQEAVVRPMVDPLIMKPWISGATELGDGGLAVILYLPQLAAHPRRHEAAAIPAGRPA